MAFFVDLCRKNLTALIKRGEETLLLETEVSHHRIVV